MSQQKSDLIGYVNDMLAVETEFHSSFRRQKDDDQIRQHAAAHKIIAGAEEIIDGHIVALKSCLTRLGGTESVVKKAVGGVLGVAAGIYNVVRSDESASRALRDDYAALCFGAICYEMLHTTALSMKDSATAELAIRHLSDFPPLIIEISKVMPSVLLAELSEESKVSPDSAIASSAVRNTREAWSNASAAH